MMYNKVCKYCGNEYTSESRNSRYCSKECCDKAQVVRKKKGKVRARKRKEYHENEEINRALTKAYSLCSAVMELYRIPKVCVCADETCSGDLQRHHKDLNVWNNSPNNLEYRCVHHHSQVHTTMPDINMVDTYNEAVDAAGFEDDDKKHEKMIQYTMDKIYNKNLEDMEDIEK